MRRLQDVVQVYPLPVSLAAKGSVSESVQIWAIGPSSNQIDRYEQGLMRCFTAEGRLKSPLPRMRHNEISASLLIRFGKTSVLLGGDVEKANWEDTLNGIQHGDLAAYWR